MGKHQGNHDEQYEYAIFKLNENGESRLYSTSTTSLDLVEMQYKVWTEPEGTNLEIRRREVGPWKKFDRYGSSNT